MANVEVLGVLAAVEELVDEDNPASPRPDILPLFLSIATYRRASVPRVRDYVELTGDYSQSDFRDHFWLDPSTFDRLLDLLEDDVDLQPTEGRGRPMAPLKQQL